MAYATLAEVRDYGVSSTDASDARVNRALSRATTAIENYTGRVFGVESVEETKIFDGISKGTIALPKPFSDITEVTINDVALTSDQWEVRDYGIILFGVRLRDADGFPFYYSWLVGQMWVSATVKVTATFGTETIDDVIKEACIMLASQYARMTDDDMTPASHISSIKSGGVTFSQAPTGKTTGNLEVDAMLESYLYGGDLVI